MWALLKFEGKWCHINDTSFFHTLVLDPSMNFLGPSFCSCPIGSLKFEVALVLGPSVNPLHPYAMEKGEKIRRRKRKKNETNTILTNATKHHQH